MRDTMVKEQRRKVRTGILGPEDDSHHRARDAVEWRCGVVVAEDTGEIRDWDPGGDTAQILAVFLFRAVSEHI